MSTVYDEKLLDKVGLAMVPSGYTNNAADEGNTGGALGKVYSVLPEQTIGNDIITNGTFDADANWSKGTGWDITGGKAVCDGTQTANTTLVQQSTILGANLEILNNKTYRVTLDVTVSAGFITNIEVGGAYRNDNITQSQIGLTFDLVSGTSGNDRFTITATPDFVGSVDNVSVQLISNGDFDFSRGSDATRVNSQGYIESVQVLSDELVQNGDFEEIGSELISNGDFEQIGSEEVTNGTFDVDSNWSGDKSISNGQLTKTGNGLAYQPLPITIANKIYKIEVDVALFANNLKIYLGDTQVDLQQGNNTLYVKGGTSNTFVGFNNGYDVGTSTGSVINSISVKEVGQNWTFGDSWNMGDGVAVSDGSSSNSNFTYQNILTLGRAYKVTLDAVVNSGSLNVYITTGITQSITSSDTYTFYGVCDRTDLDLHLKAVNFNGSVDNVSVKEVGQNWTFGDGWSITDDGGNLKVQGNNPSSTQYAYQQNVYTVGDKIRIRFDVSNFTNGQLQVVGGGIVWSTPIITAENGTFSYDVDTTGASNNHIFFRSPNATFDGTIDNVSVVKVTDDTDIPRLDYTNQACPSLLLEPERINRITKSNEFSVFQNTEGSAIALTTLTNSPENKQNAYLHTPDTSNAYHRINTNVADLVNAPSNFTYTISLFVKPNGYDFFNIRAYGSSGANFSNASFNLSNGTVDFLSPNFDSSSIEEYRDGWYRVTLTTSPTSLGTVYLRPQPSSQTNDFINIYTGDGESGCFYYGMQIEQASYPTSYIPTDGLLVTRNRDVCNNAGDSTIFNDSEGVLFLETYTLNNSNDSGTISIRGNQTPTVNLVTVKLNYSSNSIQFFIYNNGNLDVNRTINYDLSKPIKLAIKYSVEESSIWINGKQEFGGIIGFTGFSANNLKDISFDTFSGEYLEANVRSVLYFNEALSDAELEYITSADIDLTIHNYKGSLSKISATYEDVGVKDRLTKLF